MSEKAKYTAEDIRLYLEGKLTPSQMHALEKEALSDPLLADALEGMELFKNKEQFFSDADELRARINERVKNRKTDLTPAKQLWWKIAAVLVIIITGVAVIIYTGEKNKPSTAELAKTETGRDTAVADQQDEAITTVPAAPSIQDSSKAFLKKPTPVEKTSAPKKKENAAEEVLNSKVPGIQTDTLVSNQRVEAMSEVTVEAKESARAMAPGIFDESGNEVEVVVVKLRKGSKTMKNRENSGPEESEKRRVVPERGWDEFEQYLEDSTRFTKMDSTITGEEALSFIIDDAGLPKEIKILRSISPEHDKEAIRLLEKGPAWKILKGKKRHITLRIIF